jgi:hypothetical protein
MNTDKDRDATRVIARMMEVSGKRTQKELAAELETIPSTISAWKARGVVPMEWIYRAAHLFHVAPEWLISGESAEASHTRTGQPGLTILDITGAAVSLRITLPEDQQLIGIVYSESGTTQLREYVCRPVVRPWLNEHGEIVPDLGSVPYVIRRAAADDMGDWLSMVCFRATEGIGPILPGDWLLVDASQIQAIPPHIYLVAVSGRLLVRRFEVAAQGGFFTGERGETPAIPESDAHIIGRVLERAGPI